MKNMKKKILCLSFACVLVIAALVFTGCSTDELEAKIDDNAVKAETAVNEAATKAADDLAAAKADLEAKIAEGDTDNADALTAAIADLNTAIADAKAASDKLASDNDTALKTELETAIAAASKTAADATTALKTELTGKIDTLNTELTAKVTALDTAVKALESGSATATETAEIKAKAEALATDVAAIKTEITAIKSNISTLEKSFTDAKAALEQADKDIIAKVEAADKNLDDAIKALDTKLTEANQAVADACISINAWDEATDVVIEKYAALGTAWNHLASAVNNKPFLTNDVVNKLSGIYYEAQMKLLRAVNADAANAAYDYATSVFTGVEALYAELDKYNYTAEDTTYDEEGDAEIVAEFEEAIASVAASETVDIDAILDDLKSDLRNILTAAEKAWAAEINARVDALIAALDADYAYNATNKAEYEDIKANIAAWDKQVLEGEDPEDAKVMANKAVIERNDVATLDEKYNKLVDEYKAAAEALKAKLDVYNADDYVYIHNEENYNAVMDLFKEALMWAAEHQLFRGFPVDGEVEAPVHAAAGEFTDGAYARAVALNTAEAEAAELEAKIADLYDDIDNMRVIISEYKTRYDEIVNGVATWKATYFSGDYAAEAEAENAAHSNYTLLDHDEYDALVALYDTEIVPVINRAKDVVAAFEAVKMPITIDSYDSIEAVKAAYANFTNALGDLHYDLADVEGIGEYGKPGVMTDRLAELVAAYNACLSDAGEAYGELTVLTKEDVTIYTGDAVDALVDWYMTYLGLDITAETPVYPEGKEFEIIKAAGENEGLTITKDDFDKACEAYNAYNTLVDAKKADYDELKAAIDAIIADPASTVQREAIDAAQALVDAWTSGANAPDGFTAEQFAGQAEEIKALTATLDAREAEVKALEDRLAAIEDRIEALEDDYTNLEDDEAREAQAEEIEDIKATIEEFIKDNGGEDVISDEAKAALDAAELATNKADRISAIDDEYAAILEKINLITDEYVKNSLITRVTNSYNAAVDAIGTDTELDNVTLAEADFDLVAHTVDVYVANPSGFSAEILRARYEILEERPALEDAAHLEEEKVFVTDTFTKITVDATVTE